MTRFIHRALVYDRDDAFLDTAVPFARAGLEAGETVLAINSAAGITGLREALGGAADSVEFRDSTSWYAQPTRTIAAYSSFLADNIGPRIRVITEPGWEGCTPAEISEWTRYESIVNEAFADVEASVLCMYDRRVTAPEIIDGALRTHPELVGDSGPRPNDAYLDPCTVFAEVDRQPLPPPPPHAVAVQVDSADLSSPRNFIGGHARGHGMSPARLNDLLVAATEVATNAIRHGVPPITCRLWDDDGDLVVDVTDAGLWEPDAVPGFLPPDPVSRSGFGLWGVRMLCPLVQLRTGAVGTTVRLRVPLR